MNKEKFICLLKGAANGFMIAGVIILFIGLYYSIIKAGIPYQDPPMELQIQYAINMGVGEKLLRIWWKNFAIGIIGRFAILAVERKNTKEKDK